MQVRDLQQQYFKSRRFKTNLSEKVLQNKN